MVQNRDMSAAVGHAPELISVLLKASPQLLKEAMKVACENTKLKKEIIEYTHETAKAALKSQSELAETQIKGINDVNKNLSEAIVNWSKRENLSNDEIQMYYLTLQSIEKGYDKQSNSIQENKSFEENILKNEREIINSTQHNKKFDQALSVLGNVLKTPEGQQALKGVARILTSIIFNGIVK